MKRIVCLFMTLCLLTTSAFAAVADDVIAALEKVQTLRSADMTLSISTTLNQPLKFLDTIPKDEYSDIDYTLLLESLADATLYMDGSFLMSEDMRKADMALSIAFDVPVVFSEDLKLNAWAKIGSWIQYDFSDEGAPFCRVIAKNPMSTEYQVRDIDDFVMSDFSDNPEAKKQLQSDCLALLKEYASFNAIGKEYTIRFTDKTLRSYLLALLPLWMEQPGVKEMMKESSAQEAYQNLEKFLKEYTILGKNGMEIRLKMTPEGWISIEDSNIHLAVNLYDILTVCQMTTNGLNREDAWIDVTMNLKETVSAHNTLTEISIPEVNEDNAYFPDRQSSAYYSLKEEPVFENNTVYYPAEKILSHYGFVTEKTADTMAIASPDMGTSVIFRPDGTVLGIDGIQLELESPPAIQVNNKLYCSQEIFMMLGIEIYAYATGETSGSFKISSYYYIEPQISDGEDYEPEEWEYIPPYLDYYFHHDQMPPVIDGKCYMPLYEFLLQLTSGSFTYGDGTLTFTAEEENLLQIVEVTAWKDDPYIFVNGEAFPLDGTVVEQNGIMYIPLNFAEQLGMNSKATIRFYPDSFSVSYNLSIDNPAYQEDDDYVPAYLYSSFVSDQMLYTDNALLYMPAYDFFQSLGEGSFSFEGDLMTYTATEGVENAFGMQSISVRTGDGFIMVNNEEVAMEASAAEVNGVIRIPVSVAAYFGLKIDNVHVENGYSSFDFSRKNPEYQSYEPEFWYEEF